MGFFDNTLVNTTINSLIQGKKNAPLMLGRDGDIILSCKEESLLFPVSPASFTVGTTHNHNTVTLEAIGDIVLKGLSGFKTISFSSFFPANDYTYSGRALAPYDYIEIIESMALKKQPCHLSIIGTNIDIDVLIDSFNYKEDNGVGDVGYSITFKEYKIPYLNNGASVKSNTGLRERDTLAGALRKNTVIRRGDNLGAILKRAVLNTKASDVKQAELNNLYDLKDLIRGNALPKVGESVANGFKKGGRSL